MSSSVSLNIKLWWRRAWLYKLSWSLGAGVTLTALSWSMIKLNDEQTSVTPRLLDVGRRDVWLTAPTLSPRELKALTSASFGVPVQRLNPHLKLVGTLEHVEPLEGGGARLRVGLYEAQREPLREGASFTLQLEAPSLGLLLEDLTSSQRGQVALKRLKEMWLHLQARAQHLTTLALEELKKTHPSELLTQLKEDRVVMERLELLFHQEVTEQLPWGELMAGALESEEFAKIRAVALDGVELRPVFGEALKGAAKHALKSRSVWRDFKFKEPIKSVKRVGSNLQKKKDRSLNVGLQRASDQLIKQVEANLKREGALVRKEGGSLLREQAKRAHLGDHVEGWVKQVLADEPLRAHLKANYQEGVLEKLSLALQGFSQRPEVREALSEVIQELKGALSAAARALLLDHQLDHPGPNPLLIAVVEELLRGEASPVLHLNNGEGQPLEAGAELMLSERERASWLELLSLEPATAQPSTAQPTTAQPTTAQPTTAQPTTAQPTTAQPTTAQPTTAQPSQGDDQ